METIEIAMAAFLGIIVVGSVWIWGMLRREEREEVEELKRHLKNNPGKGK